MSLTIINIYPQFNNFAFSAIIYIPAFHVLLYFSRLKRFILHFLNGKWFLFGNGLAIRYTDYVYTLQHRYIAIHQFRFAFFFIAWDSYTNHIIWCLLIGKGIAIWKSCYQHPGSFLFTSAEANRKLHHSLCKVILPNPFVMCRLIRVYVPHSNKTPKLPVSICSH